MKHNCERHFLERGNMKTNKNRINLLGFLSYNYEQNMLAVFGSLLLAHSAHTYPHVSEYFNFQKYQWRKTKIAVRCQNSYHIKLAVSIGMRGVPLKHKPLSISKEKDEYISRKSNRWFYEYYCSL